METIPEFFASVRTQFPEITHKVDKRYQRDYGDDDFEFPCFWFESLAHVLNQQMKDGVPFETHARLFDFLSSTLLKCSSEVYRYIDVSIVENLFWGVSGSKAGPYWNRFPVSLKELYLNFHRRPPV